MKAKKSRPRICPNCKSSNAVPIVYGLPGWELAKEQEQGKVVLGGCVVMGDGSDPQWACKSCGTQWK